MYKTLIMSCGSKKALKISNKKIFNTNSAISHQIKLFRSIYKYFLCKISEVTYVVVISRKILFYMCCEKMTFNKYFILLVISVLSATTVTANAACTNGTDNASEEIILKRKLLCNYDSESRPRKNHKDTVDVRFVLLPKHIYATKEGDYIRLHAWTEMIWVDEYLQWNVSEYKDVTRIMLSSEKIWIPDIVQVNGRDTGSYRNSPHECNVEPSGQVTCITYISFRPSCEADYSSWPYDNQTCTLYFQTWFYKGTAINIINDGFQMETYRPNQYWSFEIANEETVQDGNDEKNDEGKFVTFPKIMYTITLRRFSKVWGITVIFPVAVMVTITLIAMSMSAETFERMYLLAINLFCHLWFITNSISWTIPIGGSSCPVIITFFRDSILINVCLLMTTVYQRKIMKKANDVPKPVEFVVTLADTKIGKWFMYPGNESKNTSTNNNPSIEDIQTMNKSRWNKVARIANRLLFLLTFFSYFGTIVATMVVLL